MSVCAHRLFPFQNRNVPQVLMPQKNTSKSTRCWLLAADCVTAEARKHARTHAHNSFLTKSEFERDTHTRENECGAWNLPKFFVWNGIILKNLFFLFLSPVRNQLQTNPECVFVCDAMLPLMCPIGRPQDHRILTCSFLWFSVGIHIYFFSGDYSIRLGAVYARTVCRL